MGLLEKHFDLAFAAPDGIKKLRELILTLAMQGKLVPQDPNEQPASELLKEIEAEKKMLVKEGKMKQPKPLLEIKPQELLYILPEGWEWVRFDQIAENSNNALKAGPFGSALKKSMYVQSGFKIYGQEQVISGDENLGNYFINNEKYHSLHSCAVKPGDMLISLVGTIGKVLVLSQACQPGIINPRLVKLSLYSGISREFIKRLLSSPLIQMELSDKSHGGTMNILNLGLLRELLLPLPPLAEQRRIVAKIDELMARCDELEKLRSDRTQKRITVYTAALNRLMMAKDSNDFSTAWGFITQHFSELYSVKENVAELRKAILQLAVMGKLVPQDPNDQPASELLKAIAVEKERLVKEGKIKQSKPLPKINPEDTPYKLPTGWEWVRVIDIVDVGTGSTPATTNPEYYDGTIPWYTSSATNNSIAETPETFITERAIKETNCKVFPSGSLIIAMYGQGKTRGQISEIVVPGATNQALAAMVFYESSRKTKPYIKYYFVKIYDEIRSIAEGAAQPNLNVGKIKETIIPLPPLAEQHRIVAKINQIMTLCDNLEKQIDNVIRKQTALLDAVMAQV